LDVSTVPKPAVDITVCVFSEGNSNVTVMWRRVVLLR
jgi:hypothetical protein